MVIITRFDINECCYNEVFKLEFKFLISELENLGIKNYIKSITIYSGGISKFIRWCIFLNKILTVFYFDNDGEG